MPEQLKLNRYQLIFNRIINRYLQYPLDSNFKDFFQLNLSEYHKSVADLNISQLNVKGYEEVIIALYQNLERQINKNVFTLEENSINLPEIFKYNNYRNKGGKYKIINCLQKKITALNQSVDYFFIHGSYATKDYLENWSDLDALAIINNRVFNSPANLSKFRAQIMPLSLWVYKFDSLAHHRFEFLTKLDLNYYPQSFFPLVLYKYCLSLIAQNQSLTIKVRDDEEEKKERLLRFKSYFESIISEDVLTIFEWKNFLAHLMLLPNLLLQQRQIYLYKKEAINKINDFLPNENWQILAQASQLRLTWPAGYLRYYPLFFFKYLPSIINRWLVMKLVYLGYRRKIVFDQEKKEMAQQAIELIKLYAKI